VRIGRRDDGSLPLAMLVVIVGVGLATLTLNTMVRGASDTNGAIGRSAALLAARSGLSSALASLRAAGATGNLGSISALPCSVNQAAQVTGTISTKDGSYATTVWYLKSDPTQQTSAWVQTNGVTCPTALLQTPRWAYVVAVGSSTGGRYKRTLIGTYQFKLRAMGNMPGGQIRVYRIPSATQDYCLTGSPATAGAALTMSVCATNADGTTVDKQKFGYMDDLTIKLMSADPTLYPNGLCAQAGVAEAAGQQLKLQDCGSTTNIAQQWVFDSASNFKGTSNGLTTNNVCWNIVTASQTLVLNDSNGTLNHDPTRACGFTTTNYQSWNVTADAGSGAAGAESGQLVNFKQFGKCLDFNYSGVNNWAFPCKQSLNVLSPDMSQVWNETWTVPDDGTTGLVYTTRPDGVTKQCMKAPSTGQTLVTMATCPASAAVAAASFLWWSRGAKAAVYDEKYRIEGTGTWAGRCLAPLPTGSTVQADWVGLAACTGDNLQKWDAVPPVSTSGLTSVIER
jgi:ricin-type beta-trefoil lectin protein